MTLFNVVGLISATALFLPILFIFIFKLTWYKSFPALLIYYFLVAGQSFIALEFMQADKSLVHNYGVLNNFLDAPLILTFMTYFSKTALFRQRMKIVIPVFILFELVVIAVYGFNIHAATIVMGPGILLVLIFSILFFVHQAKITVVYQKAAGKAIIASSLLFAYGGYAFIYIVYYLLKTPYKVDTQIVYYLITIFSSLVIATGIFFERRRVQQLTEIKVAREELKVIYGGAGTKAATS